MTKRGLYIVIEGTEGVGKTTQVELLATKLREQGRMVRIAREPDSQTELTARAIRHLTQDPRYPMNTKTEVLLYNAARSQSLEVVRLSIEAGIDCIVDRSFLTNLAVQYYGRGDINDYESIDRIIKFAVGDMYPDVMLILDAPLEALTERLHGRYHGERFDNLDKSFLERVRNGYLTEASNRAIPVLDALKAPEVLAEEIMAHIAYARDAVVDRPLKDEGGATSKVTPLDPATQAKSEPTKSNVSYLATTHFLASDRPTALKVNPAERISYYRPPNFGKKVLGAYDIIVKKILENYETATTDLAKHLATVALRNQKPFKVEKLMVEAQDVCKNLLPACAFLTLEVKEPIDDHTWELQPTTENPDIQKLLPNIDSEPAKPGIRLLSHLPRNEFEVLDAAIYSQSDQNDTSVKQITGDLKYEDKANLLKKVTDESALRSVIYSWEITGAFSQYFDLLTTVIFENVTAQKLTPRYGFETPDIIEEAGLSDLYQQSFDLSLELYSLLQSAGFESQASYAALLGHQMRFKIAINAYQLRNLLASQPTGNLKTVLTELKQHAKDVHPLLWEDF